ncbi:MAG: hypothetical protein CVU57_17830 [Deltaproteobacteria bacterium HGW-Deltaproteobacteria-15]|nr:MAG: hypothetical protein CVU57_17830 [Deltaproteobacteria bacterium HGW-Deltaproteobacteria-15]
MSQDVSQFILIAEDDFDDRLLYKEAIQHGGYQVSCAFVGSGDELIKYLHDESNPRPSLIIMDFRMPGMSFDEVISAIEENPQLNTIPLVVVTGSPVCGEEAKTCVKPTVTKPNTFDEWVHTLDQILTHRFETVKFPRLHDSISYLQSHHSST